MAEKMVRAWQIVLSVKILLIFLPLPSQKEKFLLLLKPNFFMMKEKTLASAPRLNVGPIKSAALEYAVAVSAAIFVFSFPFANKFSIFALWLLALAAIATFIARRKVNAKAIYALPVALFAFRMASLPFTPPEVTFKSVESCLPLLLMPVLFSLFRLSQAQALRFLRYAFYALLLAVAVGWLTFLRYMLSSQHTFWEVFTNPKLYTSLHLGRLLFWHASFVAIAISAIIPISFYLRAHRRVKPLMMWAAVVLSVAFIFVSGSRIGLVVSGFVLMLSLACCYRYISLPAKVGVALVLLATALFAYFSPYTITSDPTRAHLRAMGMSAAAERPAFGSGVYSMLRYIASDESAYGYNHFHNTLVDEVVQFGAVGGAALAAFFAWIAVLAIRKRDFLLMAFLAIYLPFVWVESIFMSVKGIMPFMFWFCFLVSTQDERKIAPSSPAGKALC